jgi:hypothetical protein
MSLFLNGGFQPFNGQVEWKLFPFQTENLVEGWLSLVLMTFNIEL